MGVTTSSIIAQTYVPIQSVVLTTGTNIVTLGSGGTIPQTYTDLILIMSVLATGGNNYLQFNGDNANNYSQTALYGNGSTAASNKSTSVNTLYVGQAAASSSEPSTTIVNIMNYSNTTTYKTIINRGNTASSTVILRSGLWFKSTKEAITSITINNDGTNYLANSIFTLYGIKAA
jgi:hypothetical protein